jgi:inositol-pentakisphosphate 2-kinase
VSRFSSQDLVSQRLVVLPSHLIRRLNLDLREAEQRGVRPRKRHHVYLAIDEPHGLLVQDMTTGHASAVDLDDPSYVSIALELKPKWLTQSPNAPAESRRCRTCALRLHRQSKDMDYSQSQKPHFCPLELISGNSKAVRDVVQDLLDDGLGRPLSVNNDVQSVLVEYLVRSELLARLRENQQMLDRHGILDLAKRAEPDGDFLTATTLRDCTLFLRITRSASSEGKLSVEARLGDLDLKVPEAGKVRQWRETEQMLVEGEWYTKVVEQHRVGEMRAWRDLKRTWVDGQWRVTATQVIVCQLESRPL